MSTGYVLGVDGGGTKTHAVVAAADGRIVASATGGPTNAAFAAPEVVRQSLRDSIGAALAALGPGGGEVVLACGAFAGRLSGETLERGFPIARWHLVREHDLCFAAAAERGVGAVALAGTGAFQWARGPRGEHHTDGFGSLLGDEGSAYWLVCQALTAVGRARDRRGPRTALALGLAKAVGATDDEGLGRWLYRGEHTAPRHEIAALAHVVSDAARDGDRVARGICGRAAERLLQGVSVCVRHTGLGAMPFPVVLAGGVLAPTSAVAAALERGLARRLPLARSRRPRFAPAVGGVLIALGLLGVEWTPALLERLGEAPAPR